jgi:predicted nucleic acid-binding protein
MPAADCFVDTNILLYAISTDPAEAAKTQIAQQLLLTERCSIGHLSPSMRFCSVCMNRQKTLR